MKIEQLRESHDAMVSSVADDTVFAAMALLFIAEKLDSIEKQLVHPPAYIMGPLGGR